jgi:hypothetical protein
MTIIVPKEFHDGLQTKGGLGGISAHGPKVAALAAQEIGRTSEWKETTSG